MAQLFLYLTNPVTVAISKISMMGHLESSHPVYLLYSKTRRSDCKLCWQ